MFLNLLIGSTFPPAFVQLRAKLGRDETWCPPSGWYMFGLSVPAVIALIERLPGSLRCRAYTHRFFLPNKVNDC
jgi:hypothetical protein